MWWGIGFVGFFLYSALADFLGLTTLRNGHGWMFFFGIFFPLLWLFGAFMTPRPQAPDAEPAEGLPSERAAGRAGDHAGAGAARVPPARQADGRGLQPRLRVLLLPVEGDALPGQPVPDGGRAARDLHAAADRGAAGAGGDDRLAGRRADADGPRLLPPLGRARRAATCGRASGRVYTIQTNGTLLDEEWAAFFSEHDSSSAISIDGPRELHDAYRVNKGGKGSFDQVMPGSATCGTAGVEWNVLTTVHAANADHGREVYRFLRDECGAAFVQFIPIIERVARGRRGRDGAVDVVARPAALCAGGRPRDRALGDGRAVRALPDRRLRGVGAPRRRRGLRADVRRRARQLGRRAARLCIHSETCGIALALEHTGDLYSCDHFVEPALQARQHQRDATCSSSSPRSSSGSSGSPSATRCPQLLPRVRRALRLPRRLPEGPLHLHTGRRARAQLPVRRLQGVLPPRRPADAAHGERLPRGRAPSEIMRSTPRGRQRGRNDPCTCGAAQVEALPRGLIRRVSPRARGRAACGRRAGPRP